MGGRIAQRLCWRFTPSGPRFDSRHFQEIFLLMPPQDWLTAHIAYTLDSAKKLHSLSNPTSTGSGKLVLQKIIKAYKFGLVVAPRTSPDWLLPNRRTALPCAKEKKVCSEFHPLFVGVYRTSLAGLQSTLLSTYKRQNCLIHSYLLNFILYHKSINY